MKNIVILGATGSIGESAVDVCVKEGLGVLAVTADRNIEKAEALIRRLRPKYAAMADETAAATLALRVKDTDTEVLSGNAGVETLAALPEADLVLDAIVGIAGLKPALAALAAGHDLALANKEALVTAGELVKAEAKKTGARILPVDSEHSAVFQCLQNAARPLDAVILTASGGPFYGYDEAALKKVTKEQALCHPNWRMGQKITVDCATMMNKGLELIEAVHLFDVAPEKVEILVHRQSVVHSMVRFADNSIIAQLGAPDMRLPIQYALLYPNGGAPIVPKADLAAIGQLTFAKCDESVFRPVALARRAISLGGTAPAQLNGANEAAVRAFLADQIPFYRIAEILQEVTASLPRRPLDGIESVFEADREAREAVRQIIGG